MSVFTMMVGLPGSGKSYMANKMASSKHSNVVILSSDAIRKELYGDESIQDNPAQVFDLMGIRAIELLKSGKDVIYDATNLSRKQRVGTLKRLPKNTIRICKIIWAKVETCISNDLYRKRTVGRDVIFKMLKRFQTPWIDEGWDRIDLIQNDVYKKAEINDLFAACDIPHDNPHHLNTIRQHIDNVVGLVDKMDGANANISTLRQMALFHDIGKPMVKGFENARGEHTEVAHYYQHQNVSAYMYLGTKEVYEDADKMNLLRISYLIGLHMEPFLDETKYFKNLKPDYKNIIMEFNELDKQGA